MNTPGYAFVRPAKHAFVTIDEIDHSHAIRPYNATVVAELAQSIRATAARSRTADARARAFGRKGGFASQAKNKIPVRENRLWPVGNPSSDASYQRGRQPRQPLPDLYLR
jgi:hypothetical protein